MKKISKKTVLLVAVIAFGYFLFSIPGLYRNGRAASFVAFAGNGVSVTLVPGSAMYGSGDPILVPGGVGLMLGAEFEFTNAAGEKWRADFCNGHPDYHKIATAAKSSQTGPIGYLLKAEFERYPDDDPHSYGGWWIRHMGYEKHLRFRFTR